jgi:hypothetical protein
METPFPLTGVLLSVPRTFLFSEASESVSGLEFILFSSIEGACGHPVEVSLQ